MKDNQNDLYETSDLGIAAYLIIRNKQLISAEKRPGRYSFTFLGKDECQKLAIEFVNTEFSRFDAALKNLKSLIK
jgi:hypothetical protein